MKKIKVTLTRPFIPTILPCGCSCRIKMKMKLNQNVGSSIHLRDSRETHATYVLCNVPLFTLQAATVYLRTFLTLNLLSEQTTRHKRRDKWFLLEWELIFFSPSGLCNQWLEHFHFNKKMWPLPSVRSEGKLWRGRPGVVEAVGCGQTEEKRWHGRPGVEADLMADAVVNIKANHPVNSSGCVRPLAWSTANGYGFHLTSCVPLRRLFPPSCHRSSC